MLKREKAIVNDYSRHRESVRARARVYVCVCVCV